MPAEVLYRKWRPQRFADVSGQDTVKRTLLNALQAGKVAHAYLFSGPRGTGKTTMGRLLTKAINCDRNAPDVDPRSGEPCNECASCLAYQDGRALDLVELDGASNRGIDDIRDLREKVGFAPSAGGSAHKVYLIDEVHMLTDQAFNALLKTLEEPPPHIVFILATTDAHRVPATILSRCQRHEFKRIPLAAVIDRLAHIAQAEGIDVPQEGLEAIARAATGSLRDAINLLEQVCDAHGQQPSLEAVRDTLGLIADERAALLAERTLRDDLPSALKVIGDARDDGLDLRQFQKETVAHLRALLLIGSGAETDGAWTPEQIQGMRAQSEGVAREKIVRALRLLSLADLKQDPLSPLPLELAVAEAILGEPAPAQQVSAPAPRPAAPAPRPAATRPAPPPRSAPPQRSAPPPQPARQQDAPVPADLRRENITGASAEDIARMVGSKQPVIPEAADAPEPAPTPGATAAAAQGIDLATLVERLRPLARQRSIKLDALLNGTCHAVSLEGDVLTLGFYEDTFNKKSVESAENRKVYEELASGIIGRPVTIRCIIAEKPSRAAARNPLVQHAVQQHGATIVSD